MGIIILTKAVGLIILEDIRVLFMYYSILKIQVLHKCVVTNITSIFKNVVTYSCA